MRAGHNPRPCAGHWQTVRRIGAHYWNLDSVLKQPVVRERALPPRIAAPLIFAQRIGEFYLSAYLEGLRSKGWAIFLVRGVLPPLSAVCGAGVAAPRCAVLSTGAGAIMGRAAVLASLVQAARAAHGADGRLVASPSSSACWPQRLTQRAAQRAGDGEGHRGHSRMTKKTWHWPWRSLPALPLVRARLRSCALCARTHDHGGGEADSGADGAWE